MREDPSLFLCCVSADCPPLFLHTPLQRTDHTHCCPEAARRRRANWFEKKVCDKEKGGKVIESRCRDRSLHFILLSSGSHYFPRGLKPCRGNCLWGIFDWFKEREGVFSGLGLKVMENWSQWKTLLRKYACANEHMWSIVFLITGNVCWAGPLFWAPQLPPQPLCLKSNLTQILPDAAPEGFAPLCFYRFLLLPPSEDPLCVCVCVDDKRRKC